MRCIRIFVENYAVMKRVFVALFVVLSAMIVSCGDYVSYTSTARVNGVELFYAVEGRGKPVILLHGNGGSHNDLETTTRQLAQAGYRVYAIDSRGQGANEPLDEYHYKDMAEDVYQFILLGRTIRWTMRQFGKSPY